MAVLRPAATGRGDTVVLIHGLGRGTGSMVPLSWRLQARGFRTCRIGYASTRHDLAGNLALVRSRLAGLGPVDLVGHSLGGVIAARLLRDPRGLDIRRVVQLGAPNLGSALATRMAGVWPVRHLCGPMIADLNASVVRHRPHPQIAAIAGTGGFPGIPLTRPHDGAVTVRSAWAGAGHRAAVPVLHTVLPISARAAKRVAEFLETGRIAS